MNGVETVASWLTPPVLFCVLNVMIGAIFLRSKLYPPPPGNDRHSLVRVPSFLERVKSFNRSSYLSPQPEPAARELEQPPHPVSGTNSGAEAREIHHAPEDAEANAAAREPHHAPDAAARGTAPPSHVVRTKSEAVVRAAPAARPLQKSASERISILREEEEEERWRPATVRERTAGDEEVDEKANEFINNFRQQLKLQRMESILRGGGGR